MSIVDQEQAIRELERWQDAAPPRKRPTFDDVYDHAFYSGVGWLLGSALDSHDAAYLEGLEQYSLGEHGGELLAIMPAIREWHAARPNVAPETVSAIRERFEVVEDGESCFKSPDAGSHLQILEDLRTPYLGGGDAERFAHEYARGLPPEWRNSIVVCLRPGQPVVVVRWTPERVRIRDVRAWAEREQFGQERSRWRVLPEFVVPADCARVAIPPATSHAVSARDLAARAPERAADVVPIGIAPIDAVLETGGVPRGARCIVQGPTGHGKSALLLEVAAALAASGRNVLWVATRDEPPQSICARWRQREGMSRKDAAAAPFESMLAGGNLLVIDGREHVLEDVLAAARDVDATVFLDPLQKVRTRAGADASRVEGVATALELIEASGVTVWASSALTRGSERRSKMGASYGGAGIENGATLLLDVRRDGDALTVEVLKSRYGGEDACIALTLDRARQRVAAPRVPVDPSAIVAARIRADVLEAAASKARSRRALADAVRGKASQKHAIIKELVDAGALVDRAGLVGVA